MSKAVLISIRPKWVEKILSGEKTLELRKTIPKLETPFKCYIYCTHKGGYLANQIRFLNGHVVGEFVCNRIVNLSWEHLMDVTENEVSGSCLSTYQAISYLAGNGGYGWHISNLKIYDTPKELGEFKGLRKTKFGYAPVEIKRPPQSWCYVEGLDND